MVNVVCMKWGPKYGPEYANRLYAMVKRNLKREFRFVCFTDDAKGLHKEINTQPMPEIYVPPAADVSPWRKLALLGEKLGDVEGTTLFLDLDVVIVDSIDPFFDEFERCGKFTIIENWTQMGRGIGNSSVYCFKVGAHKDVLDYYNTHTEEVLGQYDNEQMYLSLKIGDINYWPADWCASFKIHCIPKLPMRWWKTPSYGPNTKIVVFHGSPLPNQAAKGEWKKGSWRKCLKPTPWINQHWHDNDLS